MTSQTPPSSPLSAAATRVSQAEFARLEGVSRQAVGKWIRDGRLSPPGADGKLDLAQARRERALSESPLPKHQGAKAWHQADKAARAADSKPPARAEPRAPVADAPLPEPASELTADPAEPAGDAHRVSALLKWETYRLQRAKAEQAHLQLDRDAGLLVERAAVEYLLRDIAAAFAAELESLPDIHAADLAAHGNDTHAIHQTLSAACADARARLADTFAARAETLLPALTTPDSTEPDA